MLSTVEKVVFLKSIELFSQIPGGDLAQIALVSNEESHEAGEELFSEGELSDGLHLILEGRVRVQRQNKTPVELGERACLGELALLDAALRAETVTALVPTLTLKLSREAFLDVLMDKPELAIGLLKVLARRLHASAFP